jgi:hypothetical protein
MNEPTVTVEPTGIVRVRTGWTNGETTDPGPTVAVEQIANEQSRAVEVNVHADGLPVRVNGHGSWYAIRIGDGVVGGVRLFVDREQAIGLANAVLDAADSVSA